jgi:hypothetical protein
MFAIWADAFVPDQAPVLTLLRQCTQKSQPFRKDWHE